MIKKHLETSSTPIYWYRFSLKSKLNIFKNLLQKDAPGTCHGDDVGYLFKTMTSPEINKGSKEYEYCKKIIKIWTTFALKGDPNEAVEVEWKPAGKNNFYLMDFDEKFEFLLIPEENRMKFLDSLLEIDASLRNAHF